MQCTSNEKSRERAILHKVINKAKGGKGGPIGAFDPYKKTMVPVPPYMTTGSPTPSDSTTINYSRRENGNNAAKRAISNIKQFDRAPVKQSKIDRYVGKADDNQRLQSAHEEIMGRSIKKGNKRALNNKAINLNATANSLRGQNNP